MMAIEIIGLTGIKIEIVKLSGCIGIALFQRIRRHANMPFADAYRSIALIAKHLRQCQPVLFYQAGATPAVKVKISAKLILI